METYIYLVSCNQPGGGVSELLLFCGVTQVLEISVDRDIGKFGMKLPDWSGLPFPPTNGCNQIP